MRFLILAAALAVAFVSPAQAADIGSPVPLEKRVATLEREVADLKAELASLKSRTTSAGSATTRVQVCDGQTCRWVEVPAVAPSSAGCQFGCGSCSQGSCNVAGACGQSGCTVAGFGSSATVGGFGDGSCASGSCGSAGGVRSGGPIRRLFGGRCR